MAGGELGELGLGVFLAAEGGLALLPVDGTTGPEPAALLGSFLLGELPASVSIFLGRRPVCALAADHKSFEYGWAALTASVLAGAISTTCPRYITITRSAMRLMTPFSTRKGEVERNDRCFPGDCHRSFCFVVPAKP